VDGDISDAEQWLRSTPEQLDAMRTAHQNMLNVVGLVSDGGIQRTLTRLTDSYGRQTTLVARLHAAVVAGDPAREVAILRRIQEAAADHARLGQQFIKAYQDARGN
jgi:hypothetical protein